MSNNKKFFHGKSALITGSTSGIGLGIARAFAAHGCNLTLNGFGDSDEIESICNKLSALNGSSITHSPADMREPDEIEQMISDAARRFDGLDILVNNAGIQHVSRIESFATEKWDDIIATNLSSAFHTTRVALPHMLKSGWGRIINIASAHALVASPFKSAYVAAKHGLAGLTKTVALEVAEKGITVNAIAPGYVMTPLVENQIADTARAREIPEESVLEEVLQASQPTMKFIKIEEVTEMVLYLCAEKSSSVTGTIMSIDGGWTAR